MNKIEQRNSHFQGNHTEKFSFILQTLSLPRKAIAHDLGVPYSTYDNWVRGEASFPPDLIPKLYEITRDDRVLEFILEPIGRISIPRINSNPTRPIQGLELQLSIFEGKTIEAIENALEDGRITVKEYKSIHEIINKIRRISAELDISILQKVSP